jgi:hypothetical protein
MSNVRRAICLKLECNLFNSIAIFCVTGLLVSLTMALAFGVPLSEPWL